MKVLSTAFLSLVLCIVTANAQDVDAVVSSLKTNKQKADTLYHFAMKKFVRSNFESAAILFSKAIPFAQKTRDEEFVSKFRLSVANSYILGERPADGLLALQEASLHIQENTPYDLRMKYLVYNGMAYGKLHKIDSALNFYHQAEELNNRENPYKNWIVNDQIALMFQQANAYEEAEKYFDKAFKLTKAKGIRMDYGIMLYRFSNFYFVWGKASKYAKLLNEQSKFIRSGKRNYTSDPVHNMFFGNWQSKSLEEQIKFLQNVKDELINNRSFSNAALASVHMAEIYEESNQPLKALTCAREGNTLLQNEADLNNQYITSKLLYRLLKKTGHDAEAVAEADKLFALRDSILQLQQRETMLDLETKYETEKKEKDIAFLNAQNELGSAMLAKETDLKEALIRENLLKDSVVKREKDYSKLVSRENELRNTQLSGEKELKAALTRENLLKSEELTKEQKARWLLLSGTMVLIALAVIIFVLYRKQRSKNLLIQKQSDDLQMLMREIHHRVKNNLQVISSLLDLQSLTIKDRQASEAIKESRNRVYSMALIHQNLYKEENVIGIEMNDYINKLVQSLFQSYNSGENKIVLNTDIDPLLLDVDMVIPIGLVLNELISNSLKYAFNNTTSGTLHIGLKKYEDEMLLTVKDNGAGFPKGMNVFQSSSFGFKLVKAFAQKLKAKLEVYNDNGACILLHIKKIKFA
ncbi:MAG: sensor histidine kinase [Ginsengibacter sp.]